ncbi:cation:proton antiporter [Aeromicrobium phragmitis]|uniref:Cation:proton antiporter n=1 Tax=Aeromicrobium phragmitis TaxID=2478914 RepID=A0A3L8PKF1_9ACTN|nr:cation:proton antiporter [Aeromicrobium phragmitis]RLV55674.1 cation:proton antiporter [Aeromicrobium phragmitis]
MDDGHLATDLVSLTWIAAAAVLSPLLASLTRKKVPDVVWLLVLGILIGPQVLGIAEASDGVALVREIGLGLLFLLAGLELDTDSLRDRRGRRAIVTWLICFALALAGGYLLASGEDLRLAAVFAIAVTSTALGTLLPIVKESVGTASPLGRAVLTHGAIGELGPVIAMSLLLSTRSPLGAGLILIAFAVVALAVVVIPARLVRRIPGAHRAMIAGVHSTSQTLLRFAMLVLIALMAVSALFELDVVLGAFIAGMLLRRLLPRDDRTLLDKVEVAGFSLLIPVFFVTSGMALDISAVGEHLGLLAGIVAVIVVVRGVPVWLRERFDRRGSAFETHRDQIALGLYSATGLPMIVAVTEVARRTDLIDETTASVLVAAGAVTVLLFPLIADLVRSADERVG